MRSGLRPPHDGRHAATVECAPRAPLRLARVPALDLADGAHRRAGDHGAALGRLGGVSHLARHRHRPRATVRGVLGSRPRTAPGPGPLHRGTARTGPRGRVLRPGLHALPDADGDGGGAQPPPADLLGGGLHPSPLGVPARAPRGGRAARSASGRVHRRRQRPGHAGLAGGDRGGRRRLRARGSPRPRPRPHGGAARGPLRAGGLHRRRLRPRRLLARGPRRAVRLRAGRRGDRAGLRLGARVAGAAALRARGRLQPRLAPPPLRLDDDLTARRGRRRRGRQHDLPPLGARGPRRPVPRRARRRHGDPVRRRHVRALPGAGRRSPRGLRPWDLRVPSPPARPHRAASRVLGLRGRAVRGDDQAADRGARALGAHELDVAVAPVPQRRAAPAGGEGRGPARARRLGLPPGRLLGPGWPGGPPSGSSARGRSSRSHRVRRHPRPSRRGGGPPRRTHRRCPW